MTNWISEQDFGIYHALNKALQMATGEYNLVMGTDDRLNPDAVAQYRDHAYRSKADIAKAIRTIWTDDDLCRELSQLVRQRHRQWNQLHFDNQLLVILEAITCEDDQRP